MACIALTIGAWTQPLLAQEEFSDEPAVEEKPVPPELKAQLEKLIALDPALKLELDGDPAYYSRSTLYEYIDGAASIFEQYGVSAVGHADMKNGDRELTVDVYDMGSPLNAFGMYSMERSPNNDFIEVGAQGYIGKYILNFVQGRYYVKLSYFGPDEAGAALMKASAADLSKRIGKDKSLPEEKTILPTYRIVENSEKWIVGAPLGFQFMSPAWRAEYALGDEPSELFISIAESENAANERAAKFRAFLEKSGSAADAPDLGKGGFRAETSYQGKIIAAPCGRCVMVLTKPPKDVAAFWKTAREAILGAK